MNKGKITIVGFDMDGNLVDTMQANTKIFADYLHDHYGIDTKEAAQQYVASIGLPTGEQLLPLIERSSISMTRAKANEIGLIIDILTEQQVKGKAFPDVPDALKNLKANGYKLFVSSSHQQTGVGKVLTDAGIREYFDLTMGVTPEKTDFVKGIQHFKKAAEYFNLPLEIFTQETVFIGDGTSDMKIANANNIIGIGRIGTNKEESLKEAGANLVVPDFSQLADILPTLSR